LNNKEWRGKPARSCAVTRVHSKPHSMGDPSPVVFNVEVTYRPKGFISYVGTTKYDGWTAMMPNRSNAGVYLDMEGNPLKDGRPIIYLPFEVYGETAFDKLDFGEFVDELDIEGIKETTEAQVMADLAAGGKLGGSSFIAAHRSRPLKKIVLSNALTGKAKDGFGTDILNICLADTDHFEPVLMEELTKLVCGFIEGKAYITNMGNDEFTFLDLSSSLVDCEPNEQGFDSWFDVLRNYTPLGFLEDLAKRVMALYEVQATVVPGKGLVLRHDKKED
jgi:hypothetical protein